MTPLRFAITLLLFTVFLWLGSLNWAVFWKGFVRKEKAPSWIPLLAGFCGAGAMVATGIPRFMSLAWLPFVLDFGSVPGLTLTVAFFLARRYRGGA